MSNLVLLYNGERAGIVAEDTNFELPGEDWALVPEDEAPELPVVPTEDELVAPLPASTFVPFSQHPLFEQARDAAKTNPAIQVEFVTAMYASNQGDTTLLQSAIENLEELLE